MATFLTALYAIWAQIIAIYSVIEIGPNLLAAVTSIVGATVLVLQLRIASRVTKVKQSAEESSAAVVELAEKVDGNHK